jgi:hypothetical protein
MAFLTVISTAGFSPVLDTRLLRRFRCTTGVYVLNQGVCGANTMLTYYDFAGSTQTRISLKMKWFRFGRYGKRYYLWGQIIYSYECSGYVAVAKV